MPVSYLTPPHPPPPARSPCLHFAAVPQIDAKPSLPHGEHSSPKSKKIFVGGLAPETTEGKCRAQANRPWAARHSNSNSSSSIGVWSAAASVLCLSSYLYCIRL
jgi:hypothetical protein